MLKRHFPAISVLTAITLAIYVRILGHSFLINWDDHLYVTANQAAQGLTLPHVTAAFTSFFAGNYAPLHIFSYMIDYELWGMRPAGFLGMNIFLHLFNGILLYVFLIRLGWRRWYSFMAAFVFLCHPVQVESVAWISERKNLLAMSFSLLSLHSYLYFLGREPGSRHLPYSATIISYGCALLSKAIAVILPPLLILFDYCYGVNGARKRSKYIYLPFVAAALVFCFITMKSQSAEYHGGRSEFHGGSPAATFYTMLTVFTRYVRILLWPTRLSVYYDVPIRKAPDWEVLLSGGLLLLVVVIAWHLYRTRSEKFFWLAVSVLALLPVSQIVPIATLMNDRYLYFPLLGLAPLGVLLGSRGLRLVPANIRTWFAAGFAVPLVLLPLLSYQRAGVWQDSRSIWSDAYAKYPANPHIAYSLAQTYGAGGEKDMALALYEKTLLLDPEHRDALQNLSIQYLTAGRPADAYPYLIRLVAAHPGFANGYITFGNYYLDVGNYQQAEEAFRRALKIDPCSGAAFFNLGGLFLRQMRYGEARDVFREALAVNEYDGESHYYLAVVEAVTGHPDVAISHLARAIGSGYGGVELGSDNHSFDSIRDRTEYRRLEETLNAKRSRQVAR